LSPSTHVVDNVTTSMPETATLTTAHTRRPASARTPSISIRYQDIQEGHLAEQQRAQGSKKKNTSKIITSRTSSSTTRRQLFPSPHAHRRSYISSSTHPTAPKRVPPLPDTYDPAQHPVASIARHGPLY